MGATLNWLASIWPKIPRAIRALVLIMIATTGLGIGLAVGYMAWRSGYIEQRLGVVATTTDLSAQTDTIHAQVTQAVAASLAAYDASLKGYLHKERELAVDTTLKPMLNLLFRIDDRQRRMEKGQKVTDAAVEAMPREIDERLRRIVESRPPDQTEELLKDIKKRLETIEAQRQTGIQF